LVAAMPRNSTGMGDGLSSSPLGPFRGQHAGTAERPSVRPGVTALQCWEPGVSRCDDAGARALGRGWEATARVRSRRTVHTRIQHVFSACVRRCCEGRNSARDGGTEGGKGRSDGPLQRQAQHAADHTRPKSMWSRVTRRCSAFMRLIEQQISLLVNYGPDAGPAFRR
jgi:hypothetical protein